MSLYTKTALKKIKKDELVQMFLDLQAQKVDNMMDEVVEKCCNNAIEEVVEGLKEENEKLKSLINEYKDSSCIHKDVKPQEIKESFEDYEDQLEKYIEENEKLKNTIVSLKSSVYDLREARDMRDHQIKKLNRELDDWHEALFEPVEGLEHLQSGINLHFWQRCSGPWDADIEKINQK